LVSALLLLPPSFCSVFVSFGCILPLFRPPPPEYGPFEWTDNFPRDKFFFPRFRFILVRPFFSCFFSPFLTFPVGVLSPPPFRFMARRHFPLFTLRVLTLPCFFLRPLDTYLRGGFYGFSVWVVFTVRFRFPTVIKTSNSNFLGVLYCWLFFSVFVFQPRFFAPPHILLVVLLFPVCGVVSSWFPTALRQKNP